MCNSALDFFCFLFALLGSSDAFAIWIMPHAIGIEWAIGARAEADFHRLFTTTLKALGADSFKWRSLHHVSSGKISL